MHVAIIGNGAAGLAAARAVREIKPSAGITIISGEPGPAYARCLIPEVLAGARDIQDIVLAKQQFYHDYAIDFRPGKKVSSIDAGGHEITLEGGQSISYDGLLVATGASPVLPGWPGSDLPGVFTLRTAGQAVRIGEMARDCSSAVVEGGGLISLKAACALKKRGVRDVSVLVKSPHLLIKQLDRDSAGLVEEALTGIGIKFYYGAGLAAAVQGPGGTVQAVRLEDGRQLPAGLVIVGKGARPNAELLKAAGGRTARGIVVNEGLETSLSGIYAAGDCIEVTDFITGQQAVSGLWTLAVEQGRIAGCNLAGRPRKYPAPLTRQNAAQFQNVPFVSVGDVQGGEEQAVYKDSGVYRKLCFKDSRLIGFIMAGVVDRAGVYTSLIKRSKKLTALLKDRVIEGKVTGADLAPI